MVSINVLMLYVAEVLYNRLAKLDLDDQKQLEDNIKVVKDVTDFLESDGMNLNVQYCKYVIFYNKCSARIEILTFK